MATAILPTTGSAPGLAEPVVPRVPRISVGIQWTFDIPAAWRAALAAVSPPTDAHGWLHLVWEPGERWVPGERLMLYEMLHPSFIDPEHVKALRGPNPRNDGHYCSDKVPGQFQCLCRRKTESWRHSANPGITLTEWRLFRETGYVGIPWWVIQGDHGGHRLTFSQWEEELLALHGKPTAPPLFGDLPFAPFDQRVVRQVVRHNRLMQMQVNLAEFRRRRGAGYAAEQATIEQEFRRQLVSFLDADLAEPGDLFVKAAKQGELDDVRRTSIDYERFADQALPHFIETGDVLHESQMK